MMSRKDYERAALLVQKYGHDGCQIDDAFAEFFRNDNPRFDEDRFRRACVPGADVKARS